MNRVGDLVGKKFGKLSVLGFSHKTSKHSYWLCKCDCGKEKTIRSGNLTGNHTKSCGCGDHDRKSQLALRLKKANTKDPEQVANNQTYNYYRVGARQRHLDFELTRLDVTNLIHTACHYCGDPPNNNCQVIREGGNIPIKIGGIDRLDNSKGYILNNCVPCCYTCNKAKSMLSILQFRQWIIKVHNRINQI